MLVPQVLFAGLMFRLEGVAEVLSWLTASRWAMDTMGAIVRVNELRSVIRLTYEPQYVATPANLVHAWVMLGVHVVVCGAIAWVVLRRRRA